jgi:hypothetical protein
MALTIVRSETGDPGTAHGQASIANGHAGAILRAAYEDKPVGLSAALETLPSAGSVECGASNGARHGDTAVVRLTWRAPDVGNGPCGQDYGVISMANCGSLEPEKPVCRLPQAIAGISGGPARPPVTRRSKGSGGATPAWARPPMADRAPAAMAAPGSGRASAACLVSAHRPRGAPAPPRSPPACDPGFRSSASWRVRPVG